MRERPTTPTSYTNCGHHDRCGQQHGCGRCGGRWCDQESGQSEWRAGSRRADEQPIQQSCGRCSGRAHQGRSSHMHCTSSRCCMSVEDPEYSCELLAQAAELGYAPSAYKLGVKYEYGRMGCPQDAGLSIHAYNIAAQQGPKEACFALTAWCLVGAPGVLPQSDTEAYICGRRRLRSRDWARRNMLSATFTERGIGTVKDPADSKAWYKRAKEHGDKRANQRLAAMGSSDEIGLGFGRHAPQRNSDGGPVPPLSLSLSLSLFRADLHSLHLSSLCF
ncbi:hypothetical protein V8E36_007935 [Tilletia maclaganii]